MSSKIVGPMAALGLLAACLPTGGTGVSGKGNPYAPGLAQGDESVDGLIVGHRLMAAGEYELALKSYYRAASERGVDVDVLSAIGSADLKLGRLGQAERTLRRALDQDETFVPAWNNLGVVLMEKGRIWRSQPDLSDRLRARQWPIGRDPQESAAGARKT